MVKAKTSASASGKVLTAKPPTGPTLRSCCTVTALARPEAADAMLVSIPNHVISTALNCEETAERAQSRRGRPARDYSSEVGRVYSNLLINSLEGRNKDSRMMVSTTCLVPGCGVVSVKRLDKLQDLTTISCGCIKRSNCVKWMKDSASRVSSDLHAQIWGDRQVMNRKELLQKYDTIGKAAIDQIVRWEQERVSAAMATQGSAIVKLAEKSHFDFIAKEFGLTIAAVEWIVTKMKAKVRTRPQIEITTEACSMVPKSIKRNLDADYLLELKLLRATVENLGWGRGKRQSAIFNSDELTFTKAGGMTGKILPVCLWADKQTSADSVTSELKAWLSNRIEATRRHRTAQRKHHSLKDREAAIAEVL